MDDDTPSTSSSTTAQPQGTDLCSTHKITKLDTLAGIAVKYNVSVADIKRANGLLSDTAMFAKEYLLIPSKSMSVGQEYATIAGMIVTQYGRPLPLPVHGGDLDDRGSHVSSALDQLRGYYGLGAASPSGPGPDYFRGHPDDERGHFRGSDVGRSDSGEVEMTEFDRPGMPRNTSACMLEEQAGTRAGYQVDERLRRRNTDTSPARRASGLEGDTSLGDSPEHFSGDSQDIQQLQDGRSVKRPPTSSRLRGQSSVGGPSKESLFQRIKRAASQPALAGPSAPPVSQAAQSATASVSSVARSDSSFTTAQRMSSIVQGMRGKDAKKD
ncbi:hypothetical protein ABBQ38_000246 [Trebouxia sp. C0009 RCD-2024]